MEAIQVDDFPTQIVVWRGRDDQLSALDLYCKHMGASLACGEVEETEFNVHFMHGDGLERDNAIKVPYAKRIPLKLLLVHGKWMMDGSIYVWFDRDQFCRFKWRKNRLIKEEDDMNDLPDRFPRGWFVLGHQRDFPAGETKTYFWI